MRPATKRHLLSITLAAALLSLVLWIKCSYVPGQLRTKENIFLNTGLSNDTTVYFLGSSRVGNSINTAILQKTLHYQVRLLSYAGATFLSNTILARELAKQPGHKILMIELSPVAPNITAEFLTTLYINKVDIWNSIFEIMKQDLAWRHRNFYLQLYNDVLLQHLNLSADMKWLMGYMPGTISRFEPLQGNGVSSVSSFLRPHDLESSWQQAPPDTSQLMHYIRMIQRAAESNDCRVFFFSPITFRKAGEKQLVAGVWQQIPRHQRIAYPEPLLNAISHARFLHDDNHLNEDGAAVMTKGWTGILDSLLHKVHQANGSSYKP